MKLAAYCKDQAVNKTFSTSKFRACCRHLSHVLCSNTELFCFLFHNQEQKQLFQKGLNRPVQWKRALEERHVKAGWKGGMDLLQDKAIKYLGQFCVYQHSYWHLKEMTVRQTEINTFQSRWKMSGFRDYWNIRSPSTLRRQHLSSCRLSHKI